MPPKNITPIFIPIPIHSIQLQSNPIQSNKPGKSYLLDIIIAQGATILKLLSGENQPLLVGRDALLVLDLGLDVVDGVARLDIEGNGLTREGFDETVESLAGLFVFLVVVVCRLSVWWWVFSVGRSGRDWRKAYICTVRWLVFLKPLMNEEGRKDVLVRSFVGVG